MKSIISRASILTLFALLTISITADEGMYPLSEIHRVNLKAKGLKIDVKEVYNPNGPSLVDAICQVGGGTGEFVSSDGLILTNHHIAFDAVAAASTPEKDYLKNGFTAHTREAEIPATGYTCRITESYRDVSDEVLAGLIEQTPPAERSKLVRDRMNDIAKKEAGDRPNITCQVSEMFPGRSYVLFTYRLIKDVRLVYVPPIGVGNFGGEDDNWIWPRHTGDFSFMRAYVAPDGSTAEYAKDNVPFTPKRFLKVAPKGVKEGDFVMILGYPGRTYRHKTSYYVALQERELMPYLSSRFDAMIETMEKAGEGNRALQLKLADQIKGYANVTKNYKGKMQGLRRLKLVEKKRSEEAELQSFIESDPVRKQKYGNVLAEIARVYEGAGKTLRQDLVVNLLNRNGLLALANALITAMENADRSEARIQQAQKRIATLWDEIHTPSEFAILSMLVKDVAALPEDQRFLKSIPTDAELASSIVNDKGKLLEAVAAKELPEDDAIIRIAKQHRIISQEVRERGRTREGELNRLEAELLDVKMQWQKKDFMPDANSTLRLTYGYIRGYAPSDATRYSPITTLRGIVEKHTGQEPFDAPQTLIDLYLSKKYDKAFEDETLKDVPVAILYNMDTTGGNSGSPVMNAKGELVGVNFDRAYEATINDFQWSESYSRSIGVDIRYILFVAKHLGGADFLLKELGVM